MEKSISEKVIAIVIDKLGVEEKEATPQTTFKDLSADSLDVVELLMEFEKEFDMKIPDEDAEKIVTVGDAITYIETHIKK